MEDSRRRKRRPAAEPGPAISGNLKTMPDDRPSRAAGWKFQGQ